MPGFFDAIDALQQRKPDTLYVVIEGEKIEVSPEQFKEIIKHGAENFYLKSGKITLRTRKKAIEYPVLMKSQKGYKLLDGNPYWPESVVEGGFAWQIDYE